ncbi:hypothetical protein K0U07_01185 [bacterium]|nr:hypothetical protein [bacterium]
MDSVSEVNSVPTSPAAAGAPAPQVSEGGGGGAAVGVAAAAMPQQAPAAAAASAAVGEVAPVVNVLAEAKVMLAEIKGVRTREELVGVFQRLPSLMDRIKAEQQALIETKQSRGFTVGAFVKVVNVSFDVLGKVGLTASSYGTELAHVSSQLEEAMVEMPQEVERLEMEARVTDFKARVDALRTVDMRQLVGMKADQKEERGGAIRDLMSHLHECRFEGKDKWAQEVAADCDLFFKVDVAPARPDAVTTKKLVQFNQFLTWAFSNETFTGSFTNGTFRESANAEKIAGGLSVYEDRGVDALKIFCVDKDFKHDDYAVIIKQVFGKVVLGRMQRTVENLPLLTLNLLSVFLHVDEAVYPYGTLGIAFKQVSPMLDKVREELERFSGSHQDFVGGLLPGSVASNVMLVRLLVFPETQGVTEEQSSAIAALIDGSEDFPLLRLVRSVK